MLDSDHLAFLKQTEHGQIEVAQLVAGGTRMSLVRPLAIDEAYGLPSAWTADRKGGIALLSP
jgi:hypothetical protein